MVVIWNGVNGKFYKVVIYAGTVKDPAKAVWAGQNYSAVSADGLTGFIVCLSSTASYGNPNAGGGWLAGAGGIGASYLGQADKSNNKNNLPAGDYMYEVLEYDTQPTETDLSGRVIMSETFSFTPTPAEP